MADLASPVDEAFERGQLLLRIMQRARTLSLADPTHRRNIDLGLIDPGDTKADATRKIAGSFDDIEALLMQVALLDMAASVEALFRTRLGTALGEAGRLLAKQYRLPTLFNARKELLHDIEDYQGLGGLERLIGRHLSPETSASLKMIRTRRNSFAHGADMERVLQQPLDEVRDTLNEVANWL